MVMVFPDLRMMWHRQPGITTPYITDLQNGKKGEAW